MIYYEITSPVNTLNADTFSDALKCKALLSDRCTIRLIIECKLGRFESNDLPDSFSDAEARIIEAKLLNL